VLNIHINAATAKQKQHRNELTKPHTNTFSKYCEDNTKKFDIKYTHYVRSIQQTVEKLYTSAHIINNF